MFKASDKAPSVVMTASVKEEPSGLRLGRLWLSTRRCVYAVAFAGGLPILGGRVVVAAELDAADLSPGDCGWH